MADPTEPTPPPTPPPDPPPTPPRPREPADDDTAVIGRAPAPPPPGRPGRAGPGGRPDDTADLTDLGGLGDPSDPSDPSDRSELPRIDADELTGLTGLEPDAVASSGVRRVQPLSDEPSNLVARYLFPTERYRGEWRRHMIHLATPLAVGVGATVVLGLGAGLVQAYLPVPFLAPVAVLAWVLVMIWVLWQIAYWHFDRFILTDKRVMKVSGIVARDVAMMPLLRVTDMKYEQSPLGRMLNYGTFVIESAGQDQALREIEHLPNPNELYLRVVEEMYDPGAVEARMDQGGGEDERHPAGDA